MPPRFAYWTILAGGLPTAFRAADRDDLLPTFRRIQEKHPDAEMKWFARGRLWSSPEEARAYAERPRTRESRGRDWRPGGEHRDKREAHKTAARARNQAHRRERFARKQRAPGEAPPQGASSSRPSPDRPRSHRSAPRQKRKPRP
jgi:hypothetical protein